MLKRKLHVSVIFTDTDHDFHLLPTLCMESISNPSFLSLKAAKKVQVVPSKYMSMFSYIKSIMSVENNVSINSNINYNM